MASILGAVMRYFNIDTGDYITDDDWESNAFLFINHYVAEGRTSVEATSHNKGRALEQYQRSFTYLSHRERKQSCNSMAGGKPQIAKCLSEIISKDNSTTPRPLPEICHIHSSDTALRSDIPIKMHIPFESEAHCPREKSMNVVSLNQAQ